MSNTAVRGYVHRALFYDTPTHLLAAAAPFLADGLAAGEATVLSCRADHNDLLANALGHDDRVMVLTRGHIYTSSTAAVAAYRRFMLQQVAAGVTRVRLVGEVAYGHRPETWAEWIRYEAICNVALAPLPLSSVCAYDTRIMPKQVRRGVEQSHPTLLTTHGDVTNDLYVAPAVLVRRTTPGDADPFEATRPTVRIADLTDLDGLVDMRTELSNALTRRLRRRQLCADFVTAIGEVAANGLRHGRPPVRVLVWITPSRLVCTVTDHGDGFDDPLAGYLPPADTASGVGMWLARQTCDSLTAYQTPTGFMVRLTTELPSGGTPPNLAGRAASAEAAAVRADRARTRAEELLRRCDERERSMIALVRRARQVEQRLPHLRDDLQRRRQP